MDVVLLVPMLVIAPLVPLAIAAYLTYQSEIRIYAS